MKGCTRLSTTVLIKCYPANKCRTSNYRIIGNSICFQVTSWNCTCWVCVSIEMIINSNWWCNFLDSTIGTQWDWSCELRWWASNDDCLQWWIIFHSWYGSYHVEFMLGICVIVWRCWTPYLGIAWSRYQYWCSHSAIRSICPCGWW